MQTKAGFREKRRHPRIKVLYLLAYVNKEEGVQRCPISMGRVLDVSQGGVRVEVLEAVARQSEMELHIALGEREIDVCGAVVYVSTGEQGRYLIGIQFDHEVAELETCEPIP